MLELNKYPSTVFMCETTPDGRYIRCDFSKCSVHTLNKEVNIPVTYWLLNTEKNVALLEKHVSNQIHEFVSSLQIDECSDEYELNVNMLENACNEIEEKNKVLVVFNLRDPQSNFGHWMSKSLSAIKLIDAITEDISCISLSFSSRKELLLNISKLNRFRNMKARSDIMVVLSCHSSSQGQVFSCTPSNISKRCGFEEFCSLHDFVCACQDVIGSQLKAIHISSCFAMKLNCSHLDWPVDYSWLKTDLKCILSGSAKEVYETGSQTADLYLVSNLMLSADGMKLQFENLFHNAAYSLFPDLVLEMGLTFVDSCVIEQMMDNPDKDDQVTEPSCIDSSIHMVILCQETWSIALKDAICSNLQTRILSDVKSHITVLNASCGNETLSTQLKSLNAEKKLFFLILLSDHIDHSFLDNLMLLNQHGEGVFGILFYEIRLSDLNWLKLKLRQHDIRASGFVYDQKIACLDVLPVLLYFVQLVLGENGCKLAASDNSAATIWTLDDVFKEVMDVLPGLCRVCHLHQVSTVNDEKCGIIYSKQILPTESSSLSSYDDESVTEAYQKDDDESVTEAYQKDSRGDSYDDNNSCFSANLDCGKSGKKINFIAIRDGTSQSQQITSESDITSSDENSTYKFPVSVKNIPVAVDFDGKKSCASNHVSIERKESVVVADVLSKDVKDVPLMANVNEVFLYHNYLHIDVNFEEKVLDGNIVCFIKPANDEIGKREFQMCLDCTLIDIISVHEVTLSDEFAIHFQDSCCCAKHTKVKSELLTDSNKFCKTCSLLQNLPSKTSLTSLNYRKLPYALYGWCIRIWSPNRKCWPQAVYIKYRTKPSGPSLMWCQDADMNACCFTPGAYINNRSMMPCQEPPVAMATWQAAVHVPKGYNVLSSGDVSPCKQKALDSNLENKDVFFFEMAVALPASTISFAFGKFAKCSRTQQVHCPPDNQVVDISLYASQSKIKSFEEEFLNITPELLVEACRLLGKYPFSRLDLVILPRCFACMGLMNPNMMFLSQSVLCSDRSMSVRIAHEITHAWFGLLIGAKDWNEEWLSEGFATFLEERIVATVKKMSVELYENHREIVNILKYKTLEAELNEIHDDNLKFLRPKKNRNYMTALEAVNESLKGGDHPMKPHTFVVNAAIASKKFSNVHYLKGYFLLTCMAEKVGHEQFEPFLKAYVSKYHSQLVSSEIFFEFYLEYFDLPSELKDQFISDWLENTCLPNIPREPKDSNYLAITVNEEFHFWKQNNISNKRCKARGVKRKRSLFKQRLSLSTNQLVLLLEKMLELEDLLPQTLTQLNGVYNFKRQNAEVRHRWCELVVKHKYYTHYDHVRHFLIEDQGMGVYLFGELMLSGNQKQITLAKDVFNDLKDEMDKSTRQTVSELIYGDEQKH